MWRSRKWQRMRTLMYGPKSARNPSSFVSSFAEKISSELASGVEGIVGITPKPLPSIIDILANIPESASRFFASVSSPAEILSSKLVSRVEGTEVIEGGYNFVHILKLETGEPGCPFPFVLRFPIDPDNISRWQTCTAVGCMLYCQRHSDLNIPTPAIYTYSCKYGSEFIAMEYIDGDTLSDVWLDLPEQEQKDAVAQIAEIMRTMRSKTSFNLIGGIDPDGTSCPLVDGINAAGGRVCFPGRVTPQKLNLVQGIVDSLGLYNIGPYESVREYVQSVLDRQFHYMDQMLHKSTLNAHEAGFKEEMSEYLNNLTPEGAFERVKSKRDAFIAHPYDPEYPFVLRHGDLHGRNVVVSDTSPRRILAILDWDFGGSQALPLADRDFVVSSPDSDENTDVRVQQGEEIYRAQLQLDDLSRDFPYDSQLMTLMVSTRLYVLDREASTAQGKDAVTSVCADSNVNTVDAVV
ncbi:hypothetical protein EDD17DRAFT_1507041 [Pisolithus thermaeus]|nr:hypothetical protein EV401DRAFT_2095938 [Pisolithus croceorrhizus]KAI6163721.1 hypothetical protein EDD17DRAFT_1507041 [Pisolithus thermaeus]